MLELVKLPPLNSNAFNSDDLRAGRVSRIALRDKGRNPVARKYNVNREAGKKGSEDSSKRFRSASSSRSTTKKDH